MAEECDCPPCDEGLPPWLATFADLMALLMCFFVLLLSFAEMDVLKYKQVAGALKLAFGVQRDVKATEIPKGTSVIAKQYSPGKPTEVTPLEIMREKTTDDTKTNLDYTDSESRNDGGMGEADAEKIAQQKAEPLQRQCGNAVTGRRRLVRQWLGTVDQGFMIVCREPETAIVVIREMLQRPLGYREIDALRGSLEIGPPRT